MNHSSIASPGPLHVVVASHVASVPVISIVMAGGVTPSAEMLRLETLALASFCMAALEEPTCWKKFSSGRACAIVMSCV